MKKYRKIIEFIKSPLFVGLLFTSVFLWVGWTFYNAKSNLEPAPLSKWIFDTVTWVDQKTIDARFVTRGFKSPKNKIALLAVDDQALAEVGRWPWDREVIAKITDNLMGYGAKSMGFDIIFSEPQLNPTLKTLGALESKMPVMSQDLQNWIAEQKKSANPDANLAEVLNKYRDKVVSATFFDGIEVGLVPYQDICYTEAFKRWPSYIIIEGREIPPFKFEEFAMYQEKVDFAPFFTEVFGKIHETTTQKTLKERFNKPSASELTQQENALLQAEIQRADLNYCARWLIEGQDEYLPQFKEKWSEIFKDIPELAQVKPEEGIPLFQNTNLHISVGQTGFWTANVPEIQKSTANVASINKEPDTDGLMRKSQLLFRTGNEYVPSIALQTYLAATGEQAHFTMIPDSANPDQKVVGEFKLVNPETDAARIIPVDYKGQLQINYSGPQKMFPHLRASELLNNRPTAFVSQRVWDPELKIWKIVDTLVNKAEFIKDTIFIFGVTAIGVFDLRPTPFEKIFPGAEIHPNVIDNLMSESFLKPHPKEKTFMLLGLAVLGIGMSLTLAQAGALVGLLCTFLALFGIVILDQIFLFSKGWLGTIALPMSLTLFLYVFMTFYKYLTEERKKKYLKSTFSKYVSPAIVDEILKDPDNVELGGKKIRMSVFFSDVRGFTTISEKLDPQVLSAVLNDYLTPMTQIVFANKGTLDKYIGDAVMAFFGAPIHYPDHAKYACRTALQSLVKLKELQLQFKERGLPHIDVGIGINTAEMSVGNMGSDIVRNYTVMGDAVNLGARLEGTTKEYGIRIIISEFTYADVKESFTAREIDWVRVKGKNQPIRIYELMCEGPPIEAGVSKMLEAFARGFKLYHERKFNDALGAFNEALTHVPADPVSTLFVERCQDYLAEPPPPEWDGVFVMKTK